MNQHDHRAQNREAAEPEEGTRAAPKIVFVWIAILIVWGVGYYAWQIGKPLLGGDSRTPVATAHQESKPADSSSADDAAESTDAESSDPEVSNTASSEGSVSVTEHRERFVDHKEWSEKELTKVFGKP
jgi:hypothetical protein